MYNWTRERCRKLVRVYLTTTLQPPQIARIGEHIWGPEFTPSKNTIVEQLRRLLGTQYHLFKSRNRDATEKEYREALLRCFKDPSHVIQTMVECWQNADAEPIEQRDYAWSQSKILEMYWTKAGNMNGIQLEHQWKHGVPAEDGSRQPRGLATQRVNFTLPSDGTGGHIQSMHASTLEFSTAAAHQPAKNSRFSRSSDFSQFSEFSQRSELSQLNSVLKISRPSSIISLHVTIPNSSEILQTSSRIKTKRGTLRHLARLIQPARLSTIPDGFEVSPPPSRQQPHPDALSSLFEMNSNLCQYLHEEGGNRYLLWITARFGPWHWYRDSAGNTPLHLLVLNELRHPTSNPELTQRLVTDFAELFSFSSENNNGETALFLAARHGLAYVCHALLEAGSEPHGEHFLSGLQHALARTRDLEAWKDVTSKNIGQEVEIGILVCMVMIVRSVVRAVNHPRGLGITDFPQRIAAMMCEREGGISYLIENGVI